jgi:ABC-2 type transport system permease protein
MLATVRRDAAIFVSYRLRVPGQVVSMLFTLTTFYYVGKLVKPGTVGGHSAYFGYVLVGIVATLVLTAALNTAQVIRMELMAGNFERIVISPLGPIWGVVSVIIFPILYSTVFAGLMLAVAVAVYGVPLDFGGVGPAIVVGVLGSVAMACIGLLFVGALIAFKSAVGVTWVIAGLSLLGGAYFPLRLFPHMIRWVAYVQPFTPTVDLLRHLLLDTPTLAPAWSEVLRVLGFCVVLAPAAIGVLSAAVLHSRRRGTLIEL